MRHLLYLIILLLGCGEVIEDTSQEQEAEPRPAVGKADDTQPDEGEPEPEGRYFSQWDNQLHPGSTCQNTTVAMLLSRYGWEGSPDDITREWGQGLCSVA